MDYYYDVLLNFQERYCMFYEWDKDDAIDYVKKIPIYHVSSDTLVKMLTCVIQVNEEFLNNLLDKTKLKNNGALKYCAIFSDGKNSVALEFNDDGKSLYKSSLILDDELNINEFMYNISLTDVKISIIKKEDKVKETRQELKVKKILKLEIENMYLNKEYSKLKYIYLEWFNELLNDIDTMHQNMLNKLKENLTNKEYKIYELIKLSYNNV